MKYIKHFNESITSDDLREMIDDISDAANTYLIHLIDDNYLVHVNSSVGKDLLPKKIPNDLEIKMNICKRNNNRSIIKCNWYDVSNYLIPFIEIKEEEFNIKMIVYDNGSDVMTINLNDQILDNIGNFEFLHLEFIFQPKQLLKVSSFLQKAKKFFTKK